ncbi:hypothetical protein ALC60_13647, partial [Trachymyrmex zeteki]
VRRRDASCDILTSVRLSSGKEAERRRRRRKASQLREGKHIVVGASRAMPGDPRRVKEVRRPLTGGGNVAATAAAAIAVGYQSQPQQQPQQQQQQQTTTQYAGILQAPQVATAQAVTTTFPAKTVVYCADDSNVGNNVITTTTTPAIAVVNPGTDGSESRHAPSLANNEDEEDYAMLYRQANLGHSTTVCATATTTTGMMTRVGTSRDNKRPSENGERSTANGLGNNDPMVSGSKTYQTARLQHGGDAYSARMSGEYNSATNSNSIVVRSNPSDVGLLGGEDDCVAYGTSTSAGDSNGIALQNAAEQQAATSVDDKSRHQDGFDNQQQTASSASTVVSAGDGSVGVGNGAGVATAGCDSVRSDESSTTTYSSLSSPDESQSHQPGQHDGGMPASNNHPGGGSAMKSQSKHVKITLVDNENIAIRDGMTFHFRKAERIYDEHDMITGEPREKTNKPIKMSFNATSLFTVYHSDCVLASTLPRIPTTKCHRGLRAHKDHVSAQRGRVSKRFSSAICAKSSIIHGTASHVHFSWLSRLSQAVDPDTHREIAAGGVRDVTWHGRHATEEDGKANAKKTKKRKKLQSLSRGEKVKSTMKLDGPERPLRRYYPRPFLFGGHYAATIASLSTVCNVTCLRGLAEASQMVSRDNIVRRIYCSPFAFLTYFFPHTGSYRRSPLAPKHLTSFDRPRTSKHVDLNNRSTFAAGPTTKPIGKSCTEREGERERERERERIPSSLLFSLFLFDDCLSLWLFLQVVKKVSKL